MLAHRSIALVLILVAGLALAGAWAYARVPVDAIPDLSDNQAVVWAQWDGKSPEDIDTQITGPLARELQGLAGVRSVRGLSMYGTGYVYVIFDDSADFYASRTRVLERLNTVQGVLPPGVVAVLGPDATAMGQIYAFTLNGPRDLEHRRWVLDQVVVPALQGVRGVAEVAAVGGMVREYQIDVDPLRLEEAGLALDDVVAAVRAAGRDVGAMSVEQAGVESMLRGIGFVRSLADVERIVVRGDPVRGAGLLLRDVADISLGPAIRQGVLADAHGEQVGAIVAMRVGEDPQRTIDAVKERLERLRPALEGERLRAEPFYDRTDLIGETRATLQDTLIMQLGVTLVVVFCFLLHTRSGLVVGLALPMGALVTFLTMWFFGVGANLMSLAGIAIAIGVMVDMAIVMTENIHQHLTKLQDERRAAGQEMPTSPWDPTIVAAVSAAVREITPAIATAAATTIVGFLPILALDGQAGRLFTPLAITKTLAMSGAALFGLVLVPVLARLLLPPWRIGSTLRAAIAGLVTGLVLIIASDGLAIPMAHERWSVVVPGWLWAPFLAGLAGAVAWRFGGEPLTAVDVNPVSRVIHAGYRVALRWLCDHRPVFLGVCLLLTLSGFLVGLGFARTAAPLHVLARSVGGDLTTTAPWQALARTFPGLGSRFLPAIDEGSLLFMPSIPPQGGLGESLRVMQAQNRLIAAVPEVAGLMGKLGRAETALDPAPIGMVETVVQLKPYREWPVHTITADDGSLVHRPRTLDEVRAVLNAAADIPGVAPSWLGPIETRVVMLSTGIRAQLALQIAGNDLEAMERFAESAERVLQRVPGAVGVQAQRERGKPYAELRLDQERLARFGLRSEDVLMALETGLGGMPVAVSIEGTQRYQLRVRYQRELRDDADEWALLQVPIMGEHGAIPLIHLAAVPKVHHLAFTAGTPDPQAWRATLPLELARVVTVLDARRAEIVLPAGETVPTMHLADGAIRVEGVRDHDSALTWTLGPMAIRSEDGRRVTYVMLNADGVSETQLVDAGEQAIRAALATGELTLPTGSTWRWVGQYEQKVRTDRTLRWIIAMVGVVMIVLIFIGTRSWVTTAIIILANAPITIAGGLIGLWLLDEAMTTAVIVGFIALAGVMFDDGILFGTYLDQTFRTAPTTVADVRAKVLEAGLRRVRPALMTNVTTMLALIPILWSDGRGSEILRPMALPSIGGLAIGLLAMFLMPVLYAWWWERKVER